MSQVSWLTNGSTVNVRPIRRGDRGIPHRITLSWNRYGSWRSGTGCGTRLNRSSRGRRVPQSGYRQYEPLIADRSRTSLGAARSSVLPGYTMKNIDVGAITQGTLVFIALYCVHLLILPWLSETFAKGDGKSVVFGIHQFLGLATCMVSGYVAASVAGKNGFFYGLGVGAAGTLISAFAAVLWSLAMDAPFPALARLPFWMMINGLLAAVAGFLATHSADHGKSPATRGD